MKGAGRRKGGVAQLGERVLCKHEVVGSIPSASTTARLANSPADCLTRAIRKGSLKAELVLSGAPLS